jgi:hypothetical protein
MKLEQTDFLECLAPLFQNRWSLHLPRAHIPYLRFNDRNSAYTSTVLNDRKDCHDYATPNDWKYCRRKCDLILE